MIFTTPVINGIYGVSVMAHKAIQLLTVPFSVPLAKLKFAQSSLSTAFIALNVYPHSRFELKSSPLPLLTGWWADGMLHAPCADRRNISPIMSIWTRTPCRPYGSLHALHQNRLDVSLSLPADGMHALLMPIERKSAWTRCLAVRAPCQELEKTWNLIPRSFNC